MGVGWLGIDVVRDGLLPGGNATESFAMQQVLSEVRADDDDNAPHSTRSAALNSQASALSLGGNSPATVAPSKAALSPWTRRQRLAVNARRPWLSAVEAVKEVSEITPRMASRNSRPESVPNLNCLEAELWTGHDYAMQPSLRCSNRARRRVSTSPQRRMRPQLHFDDITLNGARRVLSRGTPCRVGTTTGAACPSEPSCSSSPVAR